MESKTAGFFLRRYWARFWPSIVLMVVLTLAANALTLVAPALVAAGLATFDFGSAAARSTGGSAFDLNQLGTRVLALWPFRLFDNSLTLLLLIAAVYVTQAVAVAGSNYLVGFTLVRIRTEATRLIQEDLVEHLLSLSLAFFHKSRSGKLVARITHDARGIGQALGPIVQGLLQSGIQLIGFGLYLFKTDGWLTLGAAAIVGVHFAFSYSMKGPIRRRSWDVEEAQASLASVLHEMLVTIRVTKSFGAERVELDKVRAASSSLQSANLAYGRLESLAEPARNILDAAALSAILIVAAFEFRAGALTASGLILFVYVARMVIAPANSLAATYLRLQGALANFARIRSLHDAHSDIRDGDVAKRTFDRQLDLRHVSFSYGDVEALKDISLTIAKGAVIALVGPSGAGKSTLTDLLLRLYDPQSGDIVIDGVDLRRLQLEDYRRLFGVVSQESLLFHDTIASNIRFGRPDLADERIHEAARIANAEPFILKLPRGYNTVVGDRGVRLSGGERQRVAIARAIAHDPQILILDEATSALDSESERQVQAAIERVTRDKTAVVIAHRLSTVVRADKIVVIDGGRIIDVGRHEELLQRCSFYRHVCALQFFDTPGAQPVVAQSAATA